MEGRSYTWSGGESLTDLIARREEIMVKHEAAMERQHNNRSNIPLVEVLAGALDDDDDSEACAICSI